MKCSLVMIPLHPVEVTKIWPWEQASSMVTTSYPDGGNKDKTKVCFEFSRLTCNIQQSVAGTREGPRGLGAHFSKVPVTSNYRARKVYF